MQVTGWLIYKREDAAVNKAYIDWFIRECEKQDIKLLLVFREELTIGVVAGKLTVKTADNIKLPDFCVVRTIEPLLNKQFEMLGIPVFNSSEVSYLCNNKAVTHQRLTALGVPMVDTIFLQKNLLSEYLPVPVPFVVKEATGKGGQQVYKVHNLDDWLSVRQKIESADVIIQECAVQPGKDLRVFVVGKEIVGAILRSNENDFRANYKLGGTAEWYELSQEEIRLIRMIVDHFPFSLVGIDFLFSNAGTLLFNEIEDVVGSRTLSKVSEINLLEKYVKLIRHQINKEEA
ncbi:ATP-grasp domain-containing protein [Sediminibacillus dalangtanensis]|uniref:ATP-grasp domain-containing protein n=1 Tax=Sediminibacillus dalangtanensis TaxID=2729421 RepID=A0ABX7VWJ9_9BACI|nr:ATP-grasp domain-containing protein [Sediminibacillus dalangtanensis]QTM99975.1 ATP-grasp domain-containing protein [Sediminibacillus dalangtanensis]